MSDLSDPCMSDELLMSIAANASEPHERALAREVIRRRLDDPADSDRTALATAAFELKERLGTYRALLARCTPATDEFVVTAYKDGIAAVEAAIEVVERMAKR